MWILNNFLTAATTLLLLSGGHYLLLVQLDLLLFLKEPPIDRPLHM